MTTNQLLYFLHSIKPGYLYGVLFVSAIIENLFPPIPGDTIVLIGAYLAGRGELGLGYVFVSTTLGGTVGFLALFLVFKYFGRNFFVKKNYWFFTEGNIQKVQRWFDRYGYLVILFNRFLSGARSVVSVFAGIANMKTFYVSIFTFISCIIWNGMIIGSGYILGQNWRLLVSVLKTYQRIVFLLILLLATLWIILKWKKAFLKR